MKKKDAGLGVEQSLGKRIKGTSSWGVGGN